jgi:hypothetical protein
MTSITSAALQIHEQSTDIQEFMQLFPPHLPGVDMSQEKVGE